MNKDISIIIVNWNAKDLLSACLHSVGDTLRGQGLTYEVIVVDNVAKGNSFAMLEQKYPTVRIIRNNINKGFGAANNQALTIMGARYALLLNTDTVLTRNAVSELFTFMEGHPDAAMACGQLLNADGTKQNSIAHFPSPVTLLTNTSLLERLFPGRYPSKHSEYHQPIEVDSCVGACLMVRREAIDRIGMFDERYFFFFEETDWTMRMKRAGWKIYHVPSAFIYHFQGQSIGRDERSRIEFYRSRYLFFDKWKPRSLYFLIRGILFGRLMANWLLTSVANLVLLGRHRALSDKWVVYSRLLLWHLKGCP